MLLPPSPNACVIWICDGLGGVDVPSPESPVINSLLKASTSIDARPGLETFVGGFAGISRCGFSIVSSVFENGFAGALGWLSPSSSEISDVAVSKGSSSCGIGGVGGLADKE